jgi:hypothetical protein
MSTVLLLCPLTGFDGALPPGSMTGETPTTPGNPCGYSYGEECEPPVVGKAGATITTFLDSA